jgi:hypothetical protein
MTLNKKCPNFFNFSLLITVILFAHGCAVPQKPQGGPRDIVAPKMLKATPLNETRNFSGKQIQLDFDEYFKLVNPYQEITLSPAPETPPEIKTRKKSLIIELKDSLLKETTYTLNLGKGVADVNEGNILKNFTYVFSTGNLIDSLSISGNVTNNQTLEKEKDITVMLFPLNRDSLFGKKKPAIYTTTDTSGNFRLSNLHDGAYKIYALKETAPNKIYDDEKELIGFTGKVINLKRDTADIKLQLFKQVPPSFRLVEHRFDTDGKVFLSFNKSLEKPSVRIISPADLDNQKKVDINKTKDTAYVYMRNMDFDTLKIEILDNNKPIDTTSIGKGRREAFVRAVSLKTNADLGNLLKPGIDLDIISNTPITNILPSLITLKEDSVFLSNYTLIRDTANTKHLSIKYRWKQNSTYLLSFADGAVTGFWDEKNKKIDKRFKIDKPDNYTEFTLKVNLADTAKTYIIQLLNESGDVVLRNDVIRKNVLLVYKSMPLFKYKIRVVYDANRNGKWDSGSLTENRQPENIWVSPKPILLKRNQEPQESIDVPAETTP